MKHFSFFLVMALCVGLFISCKNNKAPKQAEQTAANQESKEAIPSLPDQLLATLDTLSNLYLENIDPIQNILQFTEEELLVKPTYLLEPSQTKGLLNATQKYYAYAELITQLPIREKFKLPTDECKAEIARLAVELNDNYDLFSQQPDKPMSERMKEKYNWHKEQNTLNDFWIFTNNFVDAIYYLAINNIDPLMRSLTPEIASRLDKRLFIGRKALWTLIKYDSRIETLFNTYDNVDKGPEGYLEGDYTPDDRYSQDLNGLKQYLLDIKEKAEDVRKQRLNIK